jgi:diaminopimelate epimerase
MELTKHHGLGNDFLVLVVSEGGVPEPALARAVCDRHRGVGADGLLVLAPAAPGAPGDVTMVLLNADGSRAEMSGNGVACLAQAAVLTGLAAGPAVTVATDAGPRVVTLGAGPEPRTLRARVDMGVAAVTDADEWAGGEIARAARVEVGNPHLVLQLADAGRIEDREWLAALGTKANAAIPGGVNVEVVTPAARGAGIRMDVYERGVGLTDACGTGAVAAAAAASRWGLVGAGGIEVAMHGGSVAVGLEADSTGGAGARATLTTAVTYVAAVEYPWP